MLRTIAAALCLVVAQHALAADALDAEIARLDATLAKLETAAIPEEFKGALPGDREALTRARNTQSPVLKLYRLREPMMGVEAMTLLAERAVDTKSQEDFASLWESRRARFEAKPAAMRGTLLEIAMQQAAVNHAQKLFRASLPYAKADGVASGLYYLGEAEGYLAYAKFVASLASQSPERESRPSAAALQAAIEKLDAETTALFEKNPTARDAIPGSALLKEARELVARGWIEGAALTLLQARFDVTRRTTEKAAVAAAGEPRDSLETLWVAVSRESDRSDVVVAAVLPLARSLSKGGAPRSASKAPVKVTLVRWPYT